MDQARRRALAVRPDVVVVDGAQLCADLRSVLTGMRCLVLGQDVGSKTGTRYPARGIGILGGTAWESAAEYYRPADEMIRDRLGDPHSP